MGGRVCVRAWVRACVHMHSSMDGKNLARRPHARRFAHASVRKCAFDVLTRVWTRGHRLRWFLRWTVAPAWRMRRQEDGIRGKGLCTDMCTNALIYLFIHLFIYLFIDLLIIIIYCLLIIIIYIVCYYCCCCCCCWCWWWCCCCCCCCCFRYSNIIFIFVMFIVITYIMCAVMRKYQCIVMPIGDEPRFLIDSWQECAELCPWICVQTSVKTCVQACVYV